MDHVEPNVPLHYLPEKVRVRCIKVLKERSAPADSGCILWTGPIHAHGYGYFRIWDDGRTRLVRPHRVAWILAHGPIADPSLVIDHLCRNKRCFNVDHLDLVTDAENRRRGNPFVSPSGPHAIGSACRHGHEWPKYLGSRLVRGKPMRVCTECVRISRLKENARRVELRKAKRMSP